MAPKTDVIEQLRERVRELEEENARLKKVTYVSLPTNTMEQWVASEIRKATSRIKEQLAAEQLNNKLLRDALTTCVCAMQDYQAGIGITEMFDKGERLGRKALALPRDTIKESEN